MHDLAISYSRSPIATKGLFFLVEMHVDGQPLDIIESRKGGEEQKDGIREGGMEGRKEGRT